MNAEWLERLKYDPVSPLKSIDDEAILFFTARDLEGQKVGSIETVWRLPEPAKITKRQQADGSWKYPGGDERIRSRRNYNKLETYRMLNILISKYQLNKNHVAIPGAAEFLFSFQAKEGDFRGIYEDQYSPNYSAAIMELLIKAGYEQDTRILKGFEWLLSIRQNDGGWAIPFRTLGRGLSDAIYQQEKLDTLKPDKTKPSSHLITGIVLRAFAAHPKYNRIKEAKDAGDLLKSRFFTRDKYPDRSGKSYWLKLTYPFWWTDILSSLDSLSQLGFPADDRDILKALDWIADNQQSSGLWQTGYGSDFHKRAHLWISLAVCRMLKRYYE